MKQWRIRTLNLGMLFLTSLSNKALFKHKNVLQNLLEKKLLEITSYKEHAQFEQPGLPQL